MRCSVYSMSFTRGHYLFSIAQFSHTTLADFLYALHFCLPLRESAQTHTCHKCYE